MARSRSYKISPQGEPEYTVLQNMKQRCYYPRANGYKYYGGKGVTVCDRWLGKNGFQNFLEDVGPRPSEKHTIDRIDVNGNYEPGNVRWATWNEQNVNRSNNLETPGVRRTNDGWAVQLVIDRKVVFRKWFKNRRDAILARRLAELKYLR
jgi:hypothetical protein